MKKYFNKNIFKDKSFIKMICFTIVLLLVLVLGNSFGYVSAEGTDYLLNLTDYQSSNIYDSNIYAPWFGGDHSERSAFMYDFLSSSMDISSLDTPSNFETSNISKFVCFGSSTTYDVWCYLFTEDTFFYIPTPYQYGWTVVQKNNPEFYYFDFTVTNPNYIWTGSIRNDSFTVFYSDTYFTIGNDRYYTYNVGDSTHQPIYSNMTYYSFYTSVPYGSYSDYMLDYLTNGNHSDVIKNINYMVDDVGLKGFDNTFPSTNNSDGANAGNYMYADSADWYLSNFNGNIWSNYRTCSTVFTSNLNNYINDSLVLNDPNTDSNYTIDFDFQIYIDFYYSYCIGTSSSDPDIVLPSTTLSGSFVSGSIDDVNGTGEGYNDLFLWSCTYDAPASMGNYLSGMHIDASTFADNGYLQDFPLSALFAYMEPTNSYVINPNGSKSNITITLQQLMYLIDNGFIGRNNNLVSEKFEVRNFRLTCTANIEYGDFYDSVFHDTYESGKYSETFDLLTGDSYIGDDSMLTNYNPYTENDSTDYSSLPSTSTYPSSTNNTISTSNGNVTQTVNVTNDGAKYIPSLISKLIPTSLGDTGTGLVDTFSTMAQTNGWISVMASTVPAIPSTIWTYLTNYLGISLYLLACAFVLRLILDLL